MGVLVPVLGVVFGTCAALFVYVMTGLLWATFVAAAVPAIVMFVVEGVAD